MLVGYYKSAWDKTIGKPVFQSYANGALFLEPTGNRKQKRYLTGYELRRVNFIQINEVAP